MVIEYSVFEVKDIPTEEMPNDFFENFSAEYYAMGDVYWWEYRDRNSVLIGVCGLDVFNDTGAFLCLSWVDPAFRGCGFQKKMIRTRERKARSLGCERIVSYTSYDNYASANNLIYCGYKLYEPHVVWGLTKANYWYKSI